VTSPLVRLRTPYPSRKIDDLRKLIEAVYDDLAATSLSTEDLSMVVDVALDMVTGALAQAADLAQLAADYQGQLQASIADRAQMRADAAAEVARALAAEAALNTRVDAAAINAKTAVDSVGDLRSQLTAAVARIAALEARTLRGTTGQATVSQSLGAGTQDVPVTFLNPMPDTNYTVLVTLDTTATVQLGSISPVYPVKNKTKTGCVVPIRNSGLSVVSNVVVQIAALSLS